MREDGQKQHGDACRYDRERDLHLKGRAEIVAGARQITRCLTYQYTKRSASRQRANEKGIAHDKGIVPKTLFSQIPRDQQDCRHIGDQADHARNEYECGSSDRAPAHPRARRRLTRLHY